MAPKWTLSEIFGWLQEHGPILAVVGGAWLYVNSIATDVGATRDTLVTATEQKQALDALWLELDKTEHAAILAEVVMVEGALSEQRILVNEMQTVLDRQTELLEQNNREMAVQTVQLDMLLRERFGAIEGE